LFVDGFKVGHKKILITVVTTHERESATQEMDSFLTPEVAPEVVFFQSVELRHTRSYRRIHMEEQRQQQGGKV
jgi:hypothetical protein